MKTGLTDGSDAVPFDADSPVPGPTPVPRRSTRRGAQRTNDPNRPMTPTDLTHSKDPEAPTPNRPPTDGGEDG